MGDAELTKTQYLHHNTTASTPTTTTTATILITATATTDTTNKPNGIKAKILGNNVTVLK